MEKLVIIDGNSLINRAFYALPLLCNSKGEYSNAVFGFANCLLKAIFEIKPKYIAVALDYGKKTFRNTLYDGYKGKRRPTPRELVPQFDILRKMLKAMNITYIEKQNYEADDIIGTLSKKFDTYNIIITGDRDSLQLINDNTEVWLTKKGITEVKVMTTSSFKEEYGIDVSQFVDLKALMGDSSDNIPGVAGVGEKTALELIKTYGSLDKIYEHLDELKGKLKEKMETSKEVAYLSKTLSQIDCYMDLDVKLQNLEYDFPFNNDVYQLFEQYQFNSLLKRKDIFGENIEESVSFNKYNANKIEITEYSTLQNQIKHINTAKCFCCDYDLEKFTFAYDKNCEFYFNLQNPNLSLEQVLQALKPILEDDNIKKIVYDKKKMLHFFDDYGISFKGVDFDCILAYYLLSAGQKEAKKVNLLIDYNLEEDYNAVNLLYLQPRLLEDLQKNNLYDLYTKIEFPLIDVLYEMEQVGFKINRDVLYDLEQKYTKEVEELENTIKLMAGRDFNVNSPKQLGEVLFDDLKLHSFNNKKKSTSVEYLEEMKGMHPIIEQIIRFRKIKKIVTTYIEPFKMIIEKDGDLIHTIFNQTLTQTGRLSSSEPNLQNIPVREGDGKNLRKMFVSRYPDGCLVSADYSQIELRLLAHFSQDEQLVDAYNKGIDIHSITASEIFGVPITDVTADMRRTAKEVNFGIIYGISDFGLSQNIGCSRPQAKEYIEKYFSKYPKIKEYIFSNVEKAKTLGYSLTLLNRKRKVVELASPNYNIRQFGERIAMNAPLQGSASDIIKLAMLNVAKSLKENNMQSQLILQIHDELILDCPLNEVEKASKILKENMENVVKLSVPLTVEVNFGKTWFDC